MFSNNKNESLFGSATTTSPFGIATNSPSNQTPFGRSPLIDSPSIGCGISSPTFASTPTKPKGPFTGSTRTTQPAGFGTSLFTPQQNASIDSGSRVFSSSGCGQPNKGFELAFGATPTSSFEQKGSVVQFSPAIGTDIESHKGIDRSFNTKLNSIVCMKEYELKSQEELRLEDYESNRKGPQQSVPAFGASPSVAPCAFTQTENKMAFGQTENTMFGLVQNKLMFGQTENTPSFGQVENKPSFGQAASGLTSNRNNRPNEQLPYGSKPFGSLGLTPPTTKPFNFAATPPTFGGTASDKSFAFAPTSPTFGGNLFGTPPAQTSLNVTSVSQPFAFGGSSFGQTNAQAQNTDILNQLPQPAFNFSQMGQTNTFQPPKAATTGFPTFGKTDSAVCLLPFGNTAPGTSLPSAGKLDASPNFNFGQQTAAGQPLQSSFSALESPGHLILGQSLPSVYGTEMQSMTNNFTNLHKPVVYGTCGAPNYGSMMSQQQQQLISPFKSEQPEDFHTIVDKVYESFPYRSVFDGISVKLYTDENTTNPRMLRKIIEQESMPITSTESSPKLRMLTGPKQKPNNVNLPKCNWLGAVDGTNANYNNFILRKKSGKQLTLTKNEIFEPPRKLLQTGNTIAKHTTQNNTPPRKAESKGKNAFDTDNSNSEESPNLVAPPCMQLGFKAIQINDENFKSTLKAKSSINHLQNILENCKTPNDSNEPMGVGDNAPGSPSVLDTCGIKLTRKDYYTIPPIEEIQNYQNEKGECIIKGFTVGRHGFGNVYFSDEMDVSNLDLDEIIHFHFQEAIVYPDDDKKPPLNQGLNRPGQVTLERVWPRHAMTHKILRDPKDIEAENFIERLTLLSRQQDAVFVDYRPETGSWVFRVEHFSRFSFTESDDEEVAKELTAAKHKQEMRKQKVEKNNYEESSRNGLGGNMLDKMDDGYLQDGIPHKSLSQTKLMSVYKEGTNNVVMMRCSFFDEFASNGTSNTGPGSAQDSSIATLSGSTIRNVCGLQKRTVTCPAKYTALLNQNHVVPKGKSLIISSTGNFINGGLFKSNSFKTGWGTGFSFITTSTSVSELNSCSVNDEYEDAASNVVTFLKVDLSRNSEMMYLKEHLNAVFAESTVNHKNSEVSLFTINENHRLLKSHQDIAESLDLDFGVDFSHYRQVWNLCLALWGPNATTPTKRRELLSKWLEDATLPFLKNELKQSDTIKNIFIYLTGHKIIEAAELAEKKHFPNLSILITQSTGQESSKQLVRNQLAQWNNSGILSEIDKDILKIYMLLGGIPFLSGINVCENLDWKHALAVYFWYICPPGTLLINALQAYQSAFVSGFVSPPTPERYQCSNVKVYDVRYQIMMFFITPTMPLEKVLNPVTYTNDPLDYRLSWFLLQVFTALKLGSGSHQVTDSIHVSFSSQLEHLRLWEWSIFVLLFIKDKTYKTNAIMGILEKYLNSDRSTEQNTTTEDFLVNHLKIPLEWIHSVLANKTSFIGNNLETYQHLILAKNWCRARDIAVEHLIPDFVANKQWDNLSELLIRLLPGKADILQWDTEVGLVLDYLEFFRKITDSMELMTEMDVRQMKGELANICFRVKYFPTISPKQNVAIAELSKSLVDLLQLVYCEWQPKNVKNMQSVILALVKELPMPPDYKIGVVGKICSLFFKN